MEDHHAEEFGAPSSDSIQQAYALAREAYQKLGVNTDVAIQRALSVPISIHVWQADDVVGLESKTEAVDGGGILSTGNFPFRPRNGDEIRSDLDAVFRVLPGQHRLNLHACYAEVGGATSTPSASDASKEEDTDLPNSKRARIGIVDRDSLAPCHFSKWMDWAKMHGIHLDFNPTFFAHPMVKDGLSLSHPDDDVRNFWIRHGIVCRRIATAMGKACGSPCVTNIWIPDGIKDAPADRWGPRRRLKDSLDTILAAGPEEGIDPEWCLDSVESKLFGLGSEAYVVGSHDFYLSYVRQHPGVMLNMDMGHYHPTETIHDKISAIMTFDNRLLLHISRPVRWDSDHVVLFNDDVKAVLLELVRGNVLEKVHIALDFFDGSIDRLMAYTIGARATRQAILYALLDPGALLKQLESTGKLAEKLVIMEAGSVLPFGAVWDQLCLEAAVPVGISWIPVLQQYEKTAFAGRK